MLRRKQSSLYERAKLVLHPLDKGLPPFGVAVDYARTDTSLLVEFTTEEDTDWIVWPALAEQQRIDGLWRTTCFEVFVQTDEGYLEFNLSPSSQWASYRFSGYREGMGPAPEFVASSGMRFEGSCGLLRAQLLLPQNARRLGFTAVIQTTDGRFAHWALAHPSDKPDFHHPDSFVLELP